MYDAIDDPYCYRGTNVLRNLLNIRDKIELEKAENLLVSKRAEEPLPRGSFSYRHYRNIHRHLFRDVYAWAGRIRTVRISKKASLFCYHELKNPLIFENMWKINSLRGCGISVN